MAGGEGGGEGGGHEQTTPALPVLVLPHYLLPYASQKSTDFWLSTCLLLPFLSFRVRQRRGGEEEKEWGGHDFASHHLQRLPAKSTHTALSSSASQPFKLYDALSRPPKTRNTCEFPSTLCVESDEVFPTVLRLSERFGTPRRLQSLPIIIHQPPARPSQAHLLEAFLRLCLASCPFDTKGLWSPTKQHKCKILGSARVVLSIET